MTGVQRLPQPGGHHGHGHSNALVNAAAFHYLMQDPANAAAVQGMIVGVLTLAWGGVSVLATAYAAQCLGASGACDGPAFYWRPLLLAVGAAGLLALGWFAHRRKHEETWNRRAHVELWVRNERRRRAQFEAKIATVASPADMVRLRRLWDVAAVTLEDDQWRCRLMDRWLEEHPPVYGYQQEARASAPTRLCACPPQTGHDACEHPHGGLLVGEAELARLQAPGVAPAYFDSTRLKVVISAVVGVFVMSALNPATSTAAPANDAEPAAVAPNAAAPAVAPATVAAPAPPASSFAGKQVHCSLWTYTVSSVTDVGGSSTISGRVTNRSAQSLYAEVFSLAVDGDPEGVTAYVGGDIAPGASEPLTFHHPGLLASIDGLSMMGGGGGAC